jgi:phosphatidylglycerophosphatase A
MIEPFPNWRSICVSAVSTARHFSFFALDILFPFPARPSGRRRDYSSRIGRDVLNDGSPTPARAPDVRRAFQRAPVATLVASSLGAGLSPLAPGTAGSAVGLLLAWLLSRAFTIDGSIVFAAPGLLMSGLAIGLAGIPAATRAAREAGAKDPGFVVIDEVAGQIIASCTVPIFLAATPGHAWAAWTASFLFFRLFDIWKPGPIRRSQAYPGGWGIVADDVLAGLLAAGATAATAWIVSTGRL